MDNDTGVMYAVDAEVGDLYSINKSTGAPTLIGPTGIYINGLAAGPVLPTEPDILVLTMNKWGMIIFVVLAGIGSIYYMRRNKITG